MLERSGMGRTVAFLGVSCSCIQTPKSEANLVSQSVSHFVDEMARDISPRVGR